MSGLFPIITISLGISAGLIQLAGYFYYLTKINIGRIKPNTASWSIWTFGALLDSATYIFTTGDWIKNILPIACAMGGVVIFIYCARFGHFRKLTKFEWLIVCIDCLAIIIWWWYSSAVYANLFLVATAFISFIPIFMDAWDDPMVEDAKPWFIWTVAYGLLAIVVLLRWEKWEDLAYPLVFMILHLLVGILALDKRVPKTLKFKMINY